MICSFCSLLCDSSVHDLSECSKRKQSLAKLRSIQANRENPSPELKSVPTESMLFESRQKLRDAKYILFTGRIASVQTSRAAISLASQLNATVDFDEHGSIFQNVNAMQRSYYYGASIAEIRDHSDLMMVIDDGSLLAQFPSLPSTLRSFHSKLPMVFIYGRSTSSSMNAWRRCGFDVWSMDCEIESIPKAFAQWQQEYREGNLIHANIDPLLQRIAKSTYTSIVWSARCLSLENCDLWIERMTEWIFRQNETRRCVGLSLCSLDGTFQQVCTWQTGFPCRVHFKNGQPNYDPILNEYKTWIKRHNTLAKECVIVVVDETASSSQFDLPTSSVGMEIINIANGKEGFPVAIAGQECGADLFRADLSVLARVEPELGQVESIGSDPETSVPTAAYWLEKLAP